MGKSKLHRASVVMTTLLALLAPAMIHAQSSGGESFDAWRARLNGRLERDLIRLGPGSPTLPKAMFEVKPIRGERAITGFASSPGNAARRTLPWLPAVAAILSEQGMPVKLLGVAAVESGFNPTALSKKGALGLWQLMPETARRYGLRVDSFHDERLDPFKSTFAAAQYLKDLYEKFKDWPLVFAAYNAGEDRVERSLESRGATDFWTLRRESALPEETRRYVPAVLGKVGTPPAPLDVRPASPVFPFEGENGAGERLGGASGRASIIFAAPSAAETAPSHSE